LIALVGPPGRREAERSRCDIVLVKPISARCFIEKLRALDLARGV
jgi:hypothetical protein